MPSKEQERYMKYISANCRTVPKDGDYYLKLTASKLKLRSYFHVVIKLIKTDWSPGLHDPRNCVLSTILCCFPSLLYAEDYSNMKRHSLKYYYVSVG